MTFSEGIEVAEEMGKGHEFFRALELIELVG